ncbi:ABC transporter substrate-binding protein [Amycolatopsis nigrescens]|uniref:ABC transporter substrate-binding protein n=1 Tax=Amycolatopsis nigrescens TaxID=381445 RepID=UPI00039F416E|nr:ABC transporter substrate-binding protein [Amycolatopsis nigrescens]
MPFALTRRGFLGLAGTAGAVLLTGCGAGDAGSAAEQPRRGGRFRALFAGGGVKETMDPHLQNIYVDQARHKAVFDKLTELGPDLAAVPRLATHWESNVDATVWRFGLREALFHDGRPLTSEDVLASLARILDPAATGRFAATALAEVDLGRSRAIDPRTVEVVLRTPNAELPGLLGGSGTAVLPANYDPAKPVGTGPFRFRSFEAGRSMVATRFDEHWEGAPYVDELHILSAEADARGNAVRSGQAEYAHEMTATFARTAEAGGTVRIVATPGSTTHAIVLKTDRPPFDNPDVSMAFKLLADRKRLVDVVFAGRGLLGNDLFGKGYQYYPADLPQRERDVDEARSLLRGAGVLNQPLSIYTSTASTGFVEAATLFAEQAGEAGLKVEVTHGTSETYYKDQLVTGLIGSHRSGAMPIPSYLRDRLLSNSPFNATGWRRPEFDAAFARAQSTSDPAERAALYGQLQHTVHEQGGLLAWGHPDWLNAVSANARGVGPALPNTVDWARFDRVWLA